MMARMLCGRRAGHMAIEADVAYVAEIHEVCHQAGRPDLAVAFIERATPIADVVEKMIEAAIGFRTRRSMACRIAPFPGLLNAEPADWLSEVDP